MTLHISYQRLSFLALFAMCTVALVRKELGDDMTFGIGIGWMIFGSVLIGSLQRKLKP